MNMRRTLLTVLGALSAVLLAAQPAMPAPEKAVIPDNAVSLLDYGGVPDGITLNTQAFSKAINALVKQGGGHLNVPEGIFLTGPIGLKDGIDLHLAKGSSTATAPGGGPSSATRLATRSGKNSARKAAPSAKMVPCGTRSGSSITTTSRRMPRPRNPCGRTWSALRTASGSASRA